MNYEIKVIRKADSTEYNKEKTAQAIGDVKIAPSLIENLFEMEIHRRLINKTELGEVDPIKEDTFIDKFHIQQELKEFTSTGDNLQELLDKVKSSFTTESNVEIWYRVSHADEGFLESEGKWILDK